MSCDIVVKGWSRFCGGQKANYCGVGSDVYGPACVVDIAIAERGDEIPGFRDGDIIVAPMISPAWARYIARSGGLICEVGGWLSHTAILAREFGVTLIVGTSNVDTICDGDMLQVQLNGTVEIVTEKAGIAAVA